MTIDHESAEPPEPPEPPELSDFVSDLEILLRKHNLKLVGDDCGDVSLANHEWEIQDRLVYKNFFTLNGPIL